MNFAKKTHFITFYSYKGGVGRTLALANCARALAAAGKRVVVMDFDLEAPGLEHFAAFRPQQEGNTKLKKNSNYPPLTGFAEYLKESRAGSPPSKLDRYLHRCIGLPDDKGSVWLMPAGQRGGNAYQEILIIDWERFYREEDGYRLIENLRGHIEDELEPDYVFIDARTGLTEVGGIATHQLADLVILLFNLNQQNLEGTRWVHDSLRRLPSPPELLLVASPIPAMPTGNGTPYHERMRTIKRYLKGAKNADQPVVIPYQPILAWEERILVDQKDDPFDFDAPYLRLLNLIQKTLNAPEVYINRALEYLRNNDITGAINEMESGLQVNQDSPDLLESCALLLRTNQEQSGRVNAFLKKALSIRSRSQGETHPKTLSCIDNLVATLFDKGDFAEACALHEKALKLRRKTLGQQHPDTLRNMYNLAAIYRAKGQLPKARSLAKKALDSCRKTLGAEHNETVSAMIYMAHILWSQGDFAGARALEEKALDVRQRVLGEAHPSTLNSMSNLAITLRDQGHLTEARDLGEKTLRLCQQVLGEEHPTTLASAGNVANTLRDLGYLSEASILGNKTLETRRRILGEEHPRTLSSVISYAITLRCQGQLAEARILAEKAFDGRRRLLGEEHPETLFGMNELAAILRDQGELSGANELTEKVLDARKRVLGDEHPDTIASIDTLATILRTNNNLTEARALSEKALALNYQILGKEHPNTSRSANNLIEILRQSGDTEAATIVLQTYFDWLSDRDPANLSLEQRQTLATMRQS